MSATASPSTSFTLMSLRDRPNRLGGFHRLSEDKRTSIRTTLRRKIPRLRERPPPTQTREAAERYLEANAEGVLRTESLEDRSSFLNRLCDLIESTIPDQLSDQPFFEKMCDVMREMLQDDHQCIRAMALRLLRICMYSERNLIHMLKTHIDIFVVRSLDIRADNDAERTAAFRIIYHMLAVYEKSNFKKLVQDSKRKGESKYAFPKSIMQPVIAIALAGLRPTSEAEKKSDQPKKKNEHFEEARQVEDPLSLPSIALLMEFAVQEPDLTFEMAGTDWMVRVLTGEVIVSRRVATLVTRLFVHWLDSPRMRRKAQMNRVLEQIFAPLVDFGFFNYQAENEENRAKIETTLETFQHTFLAILRSWSGLMACAAVGSGNNVVSSSPIRLIEYLGLGTVISPSLVRIRSMIVDLICDFLDLPYADKRFGSWHEAVHFYSHTHEPGIFECSLRNDFVIAHSDRRSVYDSRLRNHVDVLESFRAMAIFILIYAQLPQSLCRLILACPDEPSSIKATLLLSDLLGQAGTVLPHEWRNSVLPLPTLLHSACESITLSTATAATTQGVPLPDESKDRFTFQHAQNAPLLLFRLDELQNAWLHSEEMSRSPPAPTSLLSLFVPRKACADNVTTDENGDRIEHMEIRSPVVAGPVSDNLLQDLLSSLSGIFEGVIDWHAADAFIERISRETKMMERMKNNDKVLLFFEKLMEWFEPSKKNLCKTPTSHVLPAAVGKAAIEFLMRLAPDEQLYHDIIERYAYDCLANMQADRLNLDAFASKYINFQGSMYYFSLLGALSSNPIGMEILQKTGILQIYVDLMKDTISVEHVKLIVSSIDYSYPGLARVILQKALNATNEQSRVWCTRFLEVLASLNLPDFADWGIRMMVGQIGDPSVKVVRHAVRLLHTWLPLHQSSIPLLRAVPFHTLGDSGTLLRVHLFTSEKETQNNLSTARETIRFWMKRFNTRYAAAVEEDMRMALLGIKRSMDGRFARSSHEKTSRYGIRMPVHLFAAMASHPTGRRLLTEEHVVKRLTEQLKLAPSTDHRASLLLKAATLALAHIGSAPMGMSMLNMEALVLMIRLAEESEVLSVRGSAFCALNVLASSEGGARTLARFGWESNWYSHVIDEVRTETTRRSSSRGSHAAMPTVLEMEGRPVSVSVSKRLTRHRSAVSESDKRMSVENEDKRKRWRSAPGRITHMIRRRMTVMDRSVSAAPRANYRSVSGADSTNGVGGDDEDDYNNDEDIEADVSLDVLHDVFGDKEDTVVGSGKRSRRCTMQSNGPLSPVPPSCSTPFALETSSSSMGNGRQHSESIVESIQYGLKATKKQLHDENGRLFAGEWTRRPHFSSSLRTQWRLSPITTMKCIEVNRNFGAPISYYFMPQNEVESLADYRSTVENDNWLKVELERTRPSPGVMLTTNTGDVGGSNLFNNFETATRRGRATADYATWTNIALPTELEIVCKGIFPDMEGGVRPIRSNSRTISTSGIAMQESGSRDDHRGQKGGYGRVRIEGAKKHTVFCFYCTANPGEVRPFHVPNDREWTTLRLHVLEAVDLLEIKHALPEKKLLALRRKHPTLFDWPCLYADVLELLDEYRFKAQSRTFLQELFYNALRLTRNVSEPLSSTQRRTSIEISSC